MDPSGIDIVALAISEWAEGEVLAPVHVIGVTSWGVVAEAHLNVEVHVRLLWDVEAGDGRLNGVSAVDEVVWALDVSFCTWLQLSDRLVEALEGLGGAHGEDQVASGLAGVEDGHSILKSAGVGDLGPLSLLAELVGITLAISLLVDVDLNSRQVSIW